MKITTQHQIEMFNLKDYLNKHPNTQIIILNPEKDYYELCKKVSITNLKPYCIKL